MPASLRHTARKAVSAVSFHRLSAHSPTQHDHPASEYTQPPPTTAATAEPPFSTQSFPHLSSTTQSPPYSPSRSRRPRQRPSSVPPASSTPAPAPVPTPSPTPASSSACARAPSPPPTLITPSCTAGDATDASSSSFFVPSSPATTRTAFKAPIPPPEARVASFARSAERDTVPIDAPSSAHPHLFSPPRRTLLRRRRSDIPPQSQEHKIQLQEQQLPLHQQQKQHQYQQQHHSSSSTPALLDLTSRARRLSFTRRRSSSIRRASPTAAPTTSTSTATTTTNSTSTSTATDTDTATKTDTTSQHPQSQIVHNAAVNLPLRSSTPASTSSSVTSTKLLAERIHSNPVASTSTIHSDPSPSIASLPSVNRSAHPLRSAVDSASYGNVEEPPPAPEPPASTSKTDLSTCLTPSHPDRVEMSAAMLHATPTPPPPPPPLPSPSPAKRLLRGLTSSQRIRRLSLSHRSKSRSSNTRSTSFSDTSPPTRVLSSSAGPSFLSARTQTDDALWTRLNPLRGVSMERDERMRRQRLASYSCSDFAITEEDNLVEIGSRLPDRAGRSTEQDVFGRRRGDINSEGSSSSLPALPRSVSAKAATRAPSSSSSSSLYSQQSKSNTRRKTFDAGVPLTRDQQTQQPMNSKKATTKQPPLPDIPPQAPAKQGATGDKPPLSDGAAARDALQNDLYLTGTPQTQGLPPFEEEETMRSIEKAIDSSKGRLRKSANMSKAFRAVIRSGDGLIRKSELIQATLNSAESKDPSMIILLDPDSCENRNDIPQPPRRKSRRGGRGGNSERQNNGNDSDMSDSQSNAGEKLNGTRSERTKGGGRNGRTSDDSASVETTSADSNGSSTTMSATSAQGAMVGFSTSMTAKQCAATLETLLREMSCRVVRLSEEIEGLRCIIRLRVTRTQGENGSAPCVAGNDADGGNGNGNMAMRRKMERKTRVLLTIREEDRIRTSVSFRKTGGLYSSRESHISLCKEIRERFQREWPAVVEALYIRLPSVTVSAAVGL